jgi:hypothetical protein
MCHIYIQEAEGGSLTKLKCFEHTIKADHKYSGILICPEMASACRMMATQPFCQDSAAANIVDSFSWKQPLQRIPTLTPTLSIWASTCTRARGSS